MQVHTSKPRRTFSFSACMLASVLCLPLVGCGKEVATVETQASSTQASTIGVGFSPSSTQAVAAPAQMAPAQVGYDLLATQAIGLTNDTIRALGAITDKPTALATLSSLRFTARQAKALREEWKTLGKMPPEDLRALRERHAPTLKATGIEAGKTLLVLGARWKTRKIRAGAITLIQISRSVNAIRKELNLFQ